jgi:hypothetical protein
MELRASISNSIMELYFHELAVMLLHKRHCAFYPNSFYPGTNSGLIYRLAKSIVRTCFYVHGQVSLYGSYLYSSWNSRTICGTRVNQFKSKLSLEQIDNIEISLISQREIIEAFPLIRTFNLN